jgi:hypothetical protein
MARCTNRRQHRGAWKRKIIDTPTEDQPGFVAEEPERCSACVRLIRPGQTYYLPWNKRYYARAVPWSTPSSRGVIRVREDLAVEVKRDRLVVQRGEAEVEVLPGEIRHLVNALAEGAARLAWISLRLAGAYREGVSYRESPTCVQLRLSHGFETWLTASP